MSEMKCKFSGAGGLGGAQRPPHQQHTRSKGEQLALACLLASLFGFVSATQTTGKANAKRERRTAAKKK